MGSMISKRKMRAIVKNNQKKRRLARRKSSIKPAKLDNKK